MGFLPVDLSGRRPLPPQSRIYISGPISGYPALNEEAFRRAERHLRTLGMRPLVPHDIRPWEHEGTDCPVPPAPGAEHEGPSAHGWMCYMRTDLIGMLGCYAIYMLRGWEFSHGARAELQVAMTAGMVVLHEQAAVI